MPVFLFLIWNYTGRTPLPDIHFTAPAAVVMDTLPPVAICHPFSEVTLNSNGAKMVPATNFDDGSYDLSGPIWFKARRLITGACNGDTLFRSQVQFCCEDLGDTVFVVLRVYDMPVDTGGVANSYLFERSSDCIARVIVKDVHKPTIGTLVPVLLSCGEYLAGSNIEFPEANDVCCLDTLWHTDQYVNYDTLCKRGLIRRRFTARDCGGNTATSTQMLTIEHEQDYFVRFPNDTLVTGCSNLTNLGKPVIYKGNCEAMNLTYNDVEIAETAIPGVCRQIQRTWTVFNWCTYSTSIPLITVPNPNPVSDPASALNRPGPVVAPDGSTPAPSIVLVRPTDTIPTNYSQYWVNNANGFTYTQLIRIIDTVAPVTQLTTADFFCDVTANDPSLWSGGNWFEAATASNDLREMTTDMNLGVTDQCAGSALQVRYDLYLDLNQDGITETKVSSDNPPPSGSIIFNNIATPSGEQRVFDARIAGISQKYRFGLQVSAYGDSIVARARWNTLGAPNTYVPMQLPYGRHNIHWFVRDQCGNIQEVRHYFAVSNDCIPPVLTCKKEWAADLPLEGDSVRVLASELIISATDNSTPPPEIELSIETAPFGTSFPVEQGGPQSFWEAECEDLGFRTLRVWARDAFGNATSCDVSVVVNDPEMQCENAHPAVRGWAYTPGNIPIDAVRFDLYHLPDTLPESSTDNLLYRYYFFNELTPWDNYAITARKDSASWLNGVTTLDLSQISRHIIGIEPFVSPYQAIAADANHSGMISTFDIVTLRRLILGIIEEVPGNTPWRFLPKDFYLPLTNPLGASIPDRVMLPALHTVRDSVDFTGVKIGDVNFSANPSAFAPVADDRDVLPVGFDLLMGEPMWQDNVCKVPLYGRANIPLIGFQFAIEFVPDNTLITGFESSFFPSDYIFWDNSLAVLRVSYDMAFSTGSGALLGNFLLGGNCPTTAVEAKLANHFLLAESYDTHSTVLKVGFNQVSGSAETKAMTPARIEVQPNPAVGSARVLYHAPDTAPIQLRITNAQGLGLYQWSGTAERGTLVKQIEMETWPSGVYYVQIDTPQGVFVQKMLLWRK